jgi:hypothetical protein
MKASRNSGTIASSKRAQLSSARILVSGTRAPSSTIAYTFYRQGWGRVCVDEPLYREGLEAVERAIALAPHGVVEEHPSQGIRTAEELRAELHAGLKWEADDFNPLRLFRERK